MPQPTGAEGDGAPTPDVFGRVESYGFQPAIVVQSAVGAQLVYFRSPLSWS